MAFWNALSDIYSYKISILYINNSISTLNMINKLNIHRPKIEYLGLY